MASPPRLMIFEEKDEDDTYASQFDGDIGSSAAQQGGAAPSLSGIGRAAAEVGAVHGENTGVKTLLALTKMQQLLNGGLKIPNMLDFSAHPNGSTMSATSATSNQSRTDHDYHAQQRDTDEDQTAVIPIDHIVQPVKRRKIRPSGPTLAQEKREEEERQLRKIERSREAKSKIGGLNEAEMERECWEKEKKKKEDEEKGQRKRKEKLEEKKKKMEEKKKDEEHKRKEEEGRKKEEEERKREEGRKRRERKKVEEEQRKEEEEKRKKEGKKRKEEEEKRKKEEKKRKEEEEELKRKEEEEEDSDAEEDEHEDEEEEAEDEEDEHREVEGKEVDEVNEREREWRWKRNRSEKLRKQRRDARRASGFGSWAGPPISGPWATASAGPLPVGPWMGSGGWGPGPQYAAPWPPMQCPPWGGPPTWYTTVGPSGPPPMSWVQPGASGPKRKFYQKLSGAQVRKLRKNNQK